MSVTTHVEAIRTLLLADAAVVALVVDRVYPLRAPQGCARPFVVLTVVSDVPEVTMDGAPASLLRAVRMQVDCYAEGYQAAHDLASAVDDVIAAQSGPDLSATRSSLQDDFDDDTGFDRVSMDFEIWR